MPLPTYIEFTNRHLFSAMEQDQDDYAELCAICQDPFSSPVETTCGHLFCYRCAHSWFSTKATCPNCRQLLYDESTRPRWIATVEIFPFDSLDFDIDQDIVLERLIELTPIFEEDEIEFDDTSIRVDYDNLLAVAVAATAWGYEQLDEDNQLRGEELRKLRKAYFTAVSKVQGVLWELRGEVITSMRLWRLLRDPFFDEDSDCEDSGDEAEDEAEEEGHLEYRDNEYEDNDPSEVEGEADFDDEGSDEDYGGPSAAEAAQEKLDTDLQNMLSYICQYATVHHQAIHW
ncbi:hypothetical protein CB0940_10987 [Cercospora beticola]|uniref:RING-type domain-containing protein n=1 Tax=Cercospora beticola TaxID=122368 RepID=A0A2G5HDP9_CERBT|nr:hypothetical protein CB0940_10987 [Cercospora beticola]PIA90684.1 hypothetical protein CB0940_10987 [Cercospora beticola]WPB07810.1 hypothetical protein RHO25_012474 [Cercospora beticola]